MSTTDAPTAVYRFYDADDRLLYVGIATALGARFRSHERTSAWWPEQQWVKAVWYPTRAEAATEERRAIREENPLHNVAGTQAYDERIRSPRKRQQVDLTSQKALALQVRAEQVRAGRTTRELAAALSVGIPTMQARLRGDVSFRHGELGKVADFLDVSLPELLARREVSQ